MNRRLALEFRRWLARTIAPCECTDTYSTGELFVWRETDASKCIRRGHHDNYETLTLR